MWESSSRIIFLALSNVDCKFCAAGMWLFYFKMVPSDSSGSSPSFDWEFTVSSAEEDPLSSPLYLLPEVPRLLLLTLLLTLDLGAPNLPVYLSQSMQNPFPFSLSLWDSPPPNWALDREFKKEYPQSPGPWLGRKWFLHLLWLLIQTALAIVVYTRVHSGHFPLLLGFSSTVCWRLRTA